MSTGERGARDLFLFLRTSYGPASAWVEQIGAALGDIPRSVYVVSGRTDAIVRFVAPPKALPSLYHKILRLPVSRVVPAEGLKPWPHSVQPLVVSQEVFRAAIGKKTRTADDNLKTFNYLVIFHVRHPTPTNERINRLVKALREINEVTYLAQNREHSIIIAEFRCQNRNDLREIVLDQFHGKFPKEIVSTETLLILREAHSPAHLLTHPTNMPAAENHGAEDAPLLSDREMVVLRIRSGKCVSEEQERSLWSSIKLLLSQVNSDLRPKDETKLHGLYAVSGSVDYLVFVEGPPESICRIVLELSHSTDTPHPTGHRGDVLFRVDQFSLEPGPGRQADLLRALPPVGAQAGQQKGKKRKRQPVTAFIEVETRLDQDENIPRDLAGRIAMGKDQFHEVLLVAAVVNRSRLLVGVRAENLQRIMEFQKRLWEDEDNVLETRTLLAFRGGPEPTIPVPPPARLVDGTDLYKNLLFIIDRFCTPGSSWTRNDLIHCRIQSSMQSSVKTTLGRLQKDKLVRVAESGALLITADGQKKVASLKANGFEPSVEWLIDHT